MKIKQGDLVCYEFVEKTSNKLHFGIDTVTYVDGFGDYPVELSNTDLSAKEKECVVLERNFS